MNIDDRIFASEPLARLNRIIIDNAPAAVATVQNHPCRVQDRDLPRGWIWRPYLNAYSFRTSGAAGTLRNVSISFRAQGNSPAGTTVALQATALANDADQFTVLVSTGIRVATFTASDGRGIPFPIDDSGPWDLWFGSAASAPRAVAMFQIGWHPVRVGGCL